MLKIKKLLIIIETHIIPHEINMLNLLLLLLVLYTFYCSIISDFISNQYIKKGKKNCLSD